MVERLRIGEGKYGSAAVNVREVEMACLREQKNAGTKGGVKEEVKSEEAETKKVKIENV
ncbi:hypothetical protein LTR08_002420 [Meristemomyces frigidus]|nr:hypothetical protein LTR08_002420 [Meristemomyces frigidus]